MINVSALDVLPSIQGHPVLQTYASAPWRLITELNTLKQQLVDVHQSAIHSSANIHGSAIISNSFIGPNVKVYEGVTIRDSIVMPGSTIGHGSEVARSVILHDAMLPRFNYVGSSLIGSGVQLGGAVMCASHRHDWRPPVLHWPGRDEPLHLEKLGAIVGDNVIISYGCHVNPGVVIGKNTLIQALIDVRGFVPPNSILRVRQKTVIIRRRPLPELSTARQLHDDFAMTSEEQNLGDKE